MQAVAKSREELKVRKRTRREVQCVPTPKRLVLSAERAACTIAKVSRRDSKRRREGGHTLGQPGLAAGRLCEDGRAGAAEDGGLCVGEDGGDVEATGAFDIHEET